MRILISKEDRKRLLQLLKEKYNCESVKLLSEKMKVSYPILEGWFYTSQYISKENIPLEVLNKINILDEKDDNWGRVKGGKKTYQILVEKYGIQEIRKRQSNGGKKSIHNLIKGNKRFTEKLLEIDIADPIFLEFYGILIGDGWLSKLKYKNKITHLIGISGHKEFDKELHLYCKENIGKMFNRSPYLKEIKNCNGRELLFSHKGLFNFLVNDMHFPIGKKLDISLPKKISALGYNGIKHIIRGMFDTDGSFYLDKTPSGNPYPCICITMRQPSLIEYVRDILLKEGFKVYYRKGRYPNVEIKLKGSKQLKKWLNEIGSSNPYKLRLMNNARVAQPG